MADAATTSLRAELDRRLLERDRAGFVDAAIKAVHDGAVTIEELYVGVLSPLLIETGGAWQAGATQVWEEHFATSATRTLVEGLYSDVVRAAADVPKNGKTALLACPAEEAHDLGLRMLADRMMLHGWNVHFLGSDTPTSQIVSAARALSVDLVALSVATHYNRLLLRDVIEELKRELPGVRIGVGGPAFAHDRHWPADELLSEAELGLGPGVELTGE